MAELHSPHHRSYTRQHAVVIGGGIAGLLAARVLTAHFDRVTIVERDVYPDSPVHRKGTPQSHHAHALLAVGRDIINDFFPGITDDLRANGAFSAHNIVPLVIVSPVGKLLSAPVEGEFMAFSRAFLEWHICQRLSQHLRIRFMTRCEVTSVLSTPDRTRVTGVQLRYRSANQEVQDLEADLVIDASGRFSKAPEWLIQMGYDAPPEERINSDIGYASRFYEKPTDFPAEWQGLIVNVRPPDIARGGLIIPIEHNRWHVTVGGSAGNHPPIDEQGFQEWAASLADPSFYEAIRVAKPITPIRGYRTPENWLRHFEQLDRWPRGFIVMGDSVCAFNPAYGQGMTVSALEAQVLDTCLRQQQGYAETNFEQHFQQHIAQTVADPWLIGTGEDLRWPSVTLQGASPRTEMKWIHKYMKLVFQQACEDIVVSQAYFDVINMIASPASLMRGKILIRVLDGAIRRSLTRKDQHSHLGPLALSPEAIAELQSRSEKHYVAEAQERIVARV
ncbi:MAG: 2-polyprenyl-6-methoxyphenol hydroxylase [Chloroflexi bacterium AL-W]|nr:2-polyprenyl-6-methoxyphenol hydroxylase [Chloroflexi bacterium AL-N1]NOK69713.1 2-polyprenyl-6-methoxyphenol hydroxylase [Chloroflexi bacterium AL-N10]NOK73683.1 2-polyprenyl-6-methoxyphenol hydroxylase [Chloroflexi bacterium AL-N5]NOK83883.1 2-polyprenyl-6-methoxyphenol hydroxylase [Chloroflexi bacterium AL-W]NOK88014.1 2-polyprenyl-6-methoxyphenol hydroxylase [Chloroflexi bacterium AL-N15]